MAAKPRKKKLLLTVTALSVTAALGTGIWFAARGGGEPVNVYPFEYIGMTEFWGDAQESYGPVTTDKIQTEFLSDTQTITEVAVKSGDQVKKGDILFSFDTTLDALSLERKRLEVEKVKVQIKAAEERLAEVRKLEPYMPAPEKEPEKEDLGEQLKEDEPYRISEAIGNDKKVYDGSKKEKALICWLKEDTAVSDAILQKLYETSQTYQQQNALQEESKNDETERNAASSASAAPRDGTDFEPDPPEATDPKEETFELPIKYVFEGKETERETETITIGKENYIFEIEEFIAHRDAGGAEKTYWLTDVFIGDRPLTAGEVEIPGYPQSSEKEQQEWSALWENGIEVRYARNVIFDGKIVQNDALISFPSDRQVELKVNEKAILVVSSKLDNLDKETSVSYSIEPANGIFQLTTENDQLFLIGTPKTTIPETSYKVMARHEVKDDEGGIWWVDESYDFSVSVISQQQKGEFYVVFKTTKDNYQKGMQTTWLGSKVIVNENGSFDLLPYDAIGFTDHTLPEEQKVEVALPEIFPGAMYTEEQLLDMEKQLYATIKEQKEKLKLAESEYNIVQRELGDGNVYAQIDGKVVSLLTEEEARERKQPFVKVSGGGGFYIEGSVSELEKAALKIGQEVTVNDWNTGNMYTGEVVSIGDFPTENDNWNGMGNPTASYYPFKAFVSEEADLEAGSHVSMSYSAAAAENGIYLEKPFVRTEKGSSYVYVRDADGKLEKRTVRVGKVLWGSYYEILSGLSEEDYLAFPYGKNVKQGADTVESDLSVLYGY